ncbi:uncharacterized protein LOC134842345 [Symsagittifera roscoffensis]|uniref:uncharacterized protein LOC134842345 n=1 Tax=Symsagittifera roscoffensis TaxID=84072 RepID=UPI00307C6934
MNLSPECSICAEELDDPRPLPCGHSYCGPHKNCLLMLKQSSGALKCALCNDVHYLDVASLKPLFGIREFLQQSGSKPSIKTPKLCNFSRCPCHPTAPVLFWCVQCSEKICQTCFENQHDGHAMKSYKSYLQNSVSNKLKEIGSQKESFMDYMSKRVDTVQKQISSIENKIQSYEDRKLILEREIEKFESIRTNEAKIRAFAKGSGSEIDTTILDSFLLLTSESESADNGGGINSNGLTLCAEFTGFRSWIAGESQDSQSVILSKGYKLWIRAKRFRSGPEKFFLGLFLGCQPVVPKENWTFNVDFELILLNNTPSKNKKLSTTHTFRAHEDDWGWNSFMDWNQMLNPTMGWIHDAKQAVLVHCTIKTSN